MTKDPGIICFRHCSTTVFCKSVPNICPVCKMCILNYTVDPFCVPYPFASTANESTTIVIRPSQGTFLNDYDVNCDLHIGVTDSNGIVYEFDKAGLIINDCSKWIDCIAVKVVPSSWDVHWDKVLQIMSKDTKWKSCYYDSIERNCFNFVIEFCNNLKHPDLQFLNKEDLCNKLILPKIQEALRYCYLYRNLKNTEYFVSN